MAHKAKFSMTKIKFLLDIGLTTAFVVSMKPVFTGQNWHEWIGIGLGGAALLHILLNLKWVINITRRFFGRVPRQARINYVLNLLLFVSFFLTVISGLMISKNLNTIQALGLSRDASMNWKQIHVWIPNVTLLIVGIHLALHWKWIAHTGKRFFALKPHLRPRPLADRHAPSVQS
jgi:cytochrome b561